MLYNLLINLLTDLMLYMNLQCVSMVSMIFIGFVQSADRLADRFADRFDALYGVAMLF